MAYCLGTVFLSILESAHLVAQNIPQRSNALSFFHNDSWRLKYAHLIRSNTII